MADFSEVSNDTVKIWYDFLEKAMMRDNTKFPFAIFLCVFFIVSLIGNMITCFVIYYDKSMHTVTNYYLLNLAVSDLALTFTMLEEILENLVSTYVHSQFTCRVQWFSMLCLWNGGILIMTAISIERYIAICHPLKVKSNPDCHRVVKIIVILWMVSIAEAIFDTLDVDAWKIGETWVCYTFPTPRVRVVNGAQAIASFIIPLIIMSFVYMSIMIKVNFKRRKCSRDKIFNYHDPRGKINNVVAMTASFTVCWLPFFVLRVLLCVLNLQQLLNIAEWWNIAWRVSCFNCWLSVVLNPIMFSLVSSKFRKSFKAIIWRSQISNY